MKRKAEGKIRPPPEHLALPSRAEATPTTKETPTLRGINIQWPFSQLLLMGVKTQEVRRYDLGHRGMCAPEEETWIVETKGPHAKATTNAVCQGMTIAPRPLKSQIIGAILIHGRLNYGFEHAPPKFVFALVWSNLC